MINTLEKVFEQVSKLPADKQSTLAYVLQAELDGDARGEELFNDSRNETLLDKLASKAIKDDKNGLSTTLDMESL